MKCSLLLLITTIFITANNYGIEALLIESMDTLRTSISVSDPSFGYFSSGILKSHTHGNYRSSWNKTLTLSADYGCGIVVAIREIDLRPRGVDKIKIFPPNDIKSVFVISNPSLFRNYTYDSYERKTVLHSPSGQLSVNFETGGGSTYTYDGFEMTFTAYKTGSICGRSQFHCWNARCIAETFKCDGHNHCGDRSEQSNCSHRTKGSTTGIAVGVVFAVIGLICIIVIVIRRAVRSRSEVQTTVIHRPPDNPTGYPPSYPQPGTGYPPSYPQPGTCYPPPPPPYTQYSPGQINSGYQ